MVRKVIQIDREKCVGCGACVNACHQGAIGLVDGKAQLLRDDYCDGLGRCLPNCPVGALQLIDREAEPAGVPVQQPAGAVPPMGGCPGSLSRTLGRAEAPRTAPASTEEIPSSLRQWPVQLKLVPVNAPYFHGARLLIAADCAAYAHGDFHRHFMRGKVTVIGCPKLDDGDYAEKLTQILSMNEIKSVTVVRMEVPCCGGIEHAVRRALENCGKMIPWQVVTLDVDGTVLDD